MQALRKGVGRHRRLDSGDQGCEMRPSVRRMLSGCYPPWQQLVDALQRNDAQALRELLQAADISIDMELPAPHLVTPLQLACKLKHDVVNEESCIQILLDAGADPNKPNEIRDGCTALHIAAEAGNFSAVMTLLRDGRTEVNALNSRGETVLHALANRPEPETCSEKTKLKECLEFLLEDPKLDVNRPSRQNRTAILNAALKKNLTVLATMLDTGRFDVDVPALRDKETARDLIKRCFPDLVLPAAGSVQKTEDTTISLFRLLYNREVDGFIQKLDAALEKDPVLSTEEKEKFLNSDDGMWTLLQYACNFGMTEVVQKLLLEGADPNATSRSRRAQLPSIAAAASGYIDILHLLLKRKGTLLAPRNGGDNALHAVLKDLHWNPENSDRHGCFDLLMQYIEKNYGIIDINAPDNNGDTPLHLAAYSGDEHYILSLLRAGAYIGTENKFGEPPIANISAAILEHYLDECVTSNGEFPRVDKYEIQFDYQFLVPPADQVDVDVDQDSTYSDCERPMHSANTSGHISPVPESNPLLYISRSKDLRHLLKHPIFTSFLTLKWYSIRPMFYVNLFFYFLFVMLMTVYILVFYDYSDEASENTSDGPIPAPTTSNLIVNSSNKVQKAEAQDSNIDESQSPVIISIILSVLLIVLIVRELFQFVMWPKRYICNWENYLEILLIIFSSMVLFGNVQDMNLRPHLSALTILLSWAELVLLIGRHPSLSTNIEMLKTVSWNFLQFLAWYSFLILAFALSFYTLFKSSQEDDNFFLNPGSSFFKTVVMVTGEFDASDIPFVLFPGTSHLVFMLFVFLVAIVLFNLLNGLAVSDTQSIKDNAELVGYVSRVKLISYTESMLLGHPLWCQTPRKCCCCCNCCCLPAFCTRPFRFTQIPWLMQMVRLFSGVLPEKKIRVLPNQECRILLQQHDQTKINESSTNCLGNCTAYKLEEEIIKSAKNLLLQKGHQSEMEIFKEMLRKCQNVMLYCEQMEEYRIKVEELEFKLRNVENAALRAERNTDKILEVLNKMNSK
ncbi:transient receptor potential cation channel protein painless-like [Schistocerca cancellata]|uniref:transient receptor potential cation channel protein painless-like n=1 Tax=Schistocerca cancellata TaxID=274614 RepID=UPI0021173F4E|nr:transient receptor potential cation channel protein painless-like [Schistocerca cancellata]